MKYLGAASVVVMVVLLALAWWSHVGLKSVRREHEKLTREARAMGLSTTEDGQVVREPAAKLEDRKPPSQQAENAEALMRKLESFAEGGRLFTEGSESEKLEAMEKMLSLVARMQRLDLRQLQLIDEMVRQAYKADRKARGELAQIYQILLYDMSKERPASSLDLMKRMADTGDFSLVIDMIMGRALSDWASRDPAMAAGWYEGVKEGLKPYQKGRFLEELIKGIAKTDPVEAHQTLQQLGEAGNPEFVMEIVKGARKGGDRSAFLEILRKEHRRGEGKQRSNNYLGVLAVGDTRGHRGFEAESGWIEQAGLTNEEMSDVLEAVNKYSPSEEKGQWLEWLQERDLPEEKIKEETASLLRNWVLKDFQMAGEWLVQQPEGELWNQAAGVYADTIFQEFPKEAVLWLESLPKGDDRQRLSQSFYARWPRDSPEEKAAAESFAQREGISE